MSEVAHRLKFTLLLPMKMCVYNAVCTSVAVLAPRTRGMTRFVLYRAVMRVLLPDLVTAIWFLLE